MNIANFEAFGWTFTIVLYEIKGKIFSLSANLILLMSEVSISITQIRH